MLAQLIVSGVAVGCVYALIALGMTILFRSTTVVNFCHGEFFMLGAFAVLVPLQTLGWSYGWCIVFSLGLLFVVGMAVERGRSEEHTSELQSLMRISYAVFCLKKKKIEYRQVTERSTQR